MENIQLIHEKIYQFLIEKHLRDDNFKFTTRITNRSSRLEHGYWFHGNEHYIAISFWSGTDWMNKTPNIYFCLTAEDCFLLISVTDSDNKREFIEQQLLNKIENLKPIGRYYKYFDDFSDENDYYLKIIQEFIDGDKKIIDEVIYANEQLLSLDENKIGFIEDQQFKKWTDRIESYRSLLKRNAINERIDMILEESIEPIIISKINIKTFPGITSCVIDKLPENNRCIFLTGENGTGKSSLLKAIGAALNHDHKIIVEYEKNYQHSPEDYDIEIELTSLDKNEKNVIKFKRTEQSLNAKINIPGYAGYGPYRLMTNQKTNGYVQDSIKKDIDINNSLFLHNTPLIDIEEGLQNFIETNGNDYINQRKEIIEELISNIIPNFNGMIWGRYDEKKNWQPTQYRIGPTLEREGRNDTDENSSTAVTFYKLATGARSVLAMIGDMMIRLIRQQPTVTDIANLSGIVLIDEIDIHLHPKFQKMLVQQLTESFPKVQFIISTHSPIPLLGAPESSAFFVIMKNYSQQTIMERIDDVSVMNLTPDTILTSPIFGMSDILHSEFDYNYEFPEENKSFSGLRTEATWDAAKVADAELEALIRKYRQRKGGNI